MSNPVKPVGVWRDPRSDCARAEALVSALFFVLLMLGGALWWVGLLTTGN